jgi:hypothetical protein
MLLHLHHVPGRLRVCLERLRGDLSAVAPLNAELLSIPGVDSASLNPRTGSVTIYYQRDVFEIGTFWERLRELDYLGDPSSAESGVPCRLKEATVTKAASALGEALASAAVKHLIDRSAWSLLKLLV